MNEDLLNPNVYSLKDILILNSLNNVISEPTRQHAPLDPIIIHNDMSFLHQGILEIPPEISDHSATYLYLPFQYPLHRSFTRKVWLYKMQTWLSAVCDCGISWSYSLTIFELLNNKIRQFDWTCLNQGSVNDASTLFNNIFIEFIKLVKLSLSEKMTNHGLTLTFDEIHGKEIGKKDKQLKQVI